MKCRCPACGRSTEIEAELVDFLARCQRCGVLLRARSSDLEDGKTHDPKSRAVVNVVSSSRGGYAREEVVGNGKIADLLSRPRTSRPPGPGASAEGGDADASPPGKPPVKTPAHARPRRKLSAAAWRRSQLRERHQLLGIIGILGLGFCALITFGALALHTGHLFLRAARATGDIVHTPPPPSPNR